MKLDSLVNRLAAAGILAVVPLGLLHFLGRDKVALSSMTHFLSVSVAAVAATGAGAALSVVGARRGDARSVLVGTAFSSMAALLAVHGLASPGVLIGSNGVVAFSGAATLPLGGAVLALSALPGLRGRSGVRRLLALQLVLFAGIVALGVVGMAVPAAVPSVPEPGGGAALALLAVGLAFYGLLALRALRTFLLARRAGDLLVLVGIVWLAAALVAALMLTYLDLGWWLGHAFEIAGIVLVGVPVVADLFHRASTRPLLGDLSGAELVCEEEAYLGADVHVLLERLAEKDAYTEGHTRRVALLAVRVGEELGLPATRLRDLAVGGLLHDIGKLGVPDAVLKKPGPLDPDEFEVVKRHPVRGERLLGDLGFPERVRGLVLEHHERLDGHGYPRGLGRTMGFEARILAVCDVYDALISPRVYRPAWSEEDALVWLRSQAGTAFDSRCVSALERVLGRPGVGVAGAPVALPAR